MLSEITNVSRNLVQEQIENKCRSNLDEKNIQALRFLKVIEAILFFNLKSIFYFFYLLDLVYLLK